MLHRRSIQQEQSDYRIHVSPRSSRIYIFRTTYLQQLVKKYKFKVKPAFIGGVKTATGYLIPLSVLDPIPIPILTLKHNSAQFISPFVSQAFNNKLTLQEKGDIAEELVCCLFSTKQPRLVSDIKEQYKGIDIVLNNGIKLEVKCDEPAGPKKIKGCTGNVYIQLSERRL